MQDWLTAIFGSADGGVNTLQMSARAAVIFVYGVAAIRLVGRRIFGRWAALDVVLSVLVGSNLSRALTGNAPLITTLAATTFLLILYWAAVMASLRWDLVSRLVKGRAVTLVDEGKVNRRAMHLHGIGRRDLDEALHAKGFESLDDVLRIRLERNGDINVIAR